MYLSTKLRHWDSGITHYVTASKGCHLAIKVSVWIFCYPYISVPMFWLCPPHIRISQSLIFRLIWKIIPFIHSFAWYFNYMFSIAKQTTRTQNMSEVIYSLSEKTFSHKVWSIHPRETQNCELAVLTAFTLLKSMNSTGFKPPTLWSLLQPLTHKNTNYVIQFLSKLHVYRKSLDLLAQ